MSRSAAQKAELRKKAKHELKEMIGIFLYLVFFFVALSIYM
ncbi:MAG: hypothetical protein WCC92_01015 [Candidatus Korobacteraceae bacterium]